MGWDTLWYSSTWLENPRFGFSQRHLHDFWGISQGISQLCHSASRWLAMGHMIWCILEYSVDSQSITTNSLGTFDILGLGKGQGFRLRLSMTIFDFDGHSWDTIAMQLFDALKVLLAHTLVGSRHNVLLWYHQNTDMVWRERNPRPPIILEFVQGKIFRKESGVSYIFPF